MVAIILILGMPLWNSCESSKIVETKTVYVYPQLYFPELKDPTNICHPLDENYHVVRSLVDENGKEIEIEWVLMPYWYFILFADYKTDVRKAQAEYESFIAHLNN